MPGIQLSPFPHKKSRLMSGFFYAETGSAFITL
jgi:hypothetical protein